MMTNNDDPSFGALWSISYMATQRIDIPDEHRQKFLDRQSRELTGLFDPPPGLNPAEYSALFVSHFMKSRQESREIIDKASEQLQHYSTIVQVGNKECVDELNKIESAPEFKGWGNDRFWVEEFRRLYNQYNQ